MLTRAAQKPSRDLAGAVYRSTENALERIFQRQLNTARRIGGSDAPEVSGSVYVGGGAAPVDAIEGVEQLGAELEHVTFEEVEVLLDAEVLRDGTVGPEDVVAGRGGTESKGGGLGPGVDIELPLAALESAATSRKVVKTFSKASGVCA